MWRDRGPKGRGGQYDFSIDFCCFGNVRRFLRQLIFDKRRDRGPNDRGSNAGFIEGFLLGNWKAFFKAMKPTVIQRLLANE